MTYTKLLVFALKEYVSVLLIDTDVLVMKNVDALLELKIPFGAVAALPYSTSVFNSGVILVHPNVATCYRLHMVNTTKIKRSGERFATTDQSILNHYFRKTWYKLPHGYNAGIKIKIVNPTMWNSIEKAIIHFVHRPKPWEHALENAYTKEARLITKNRLALLFKEWKLRC